MQDTKIMPPNVALNGAELAQKLQLNPEDEFKAWRKLYKYLNAQGIKLSAEDTIYESVEVQVVQHYANNRNVHIANAARRFAKERGIFLEDYSLLNDTPSKPAPQPKPAPEPPSPQAKSTPEPPKSTSVASTVAQNATPPIELHGIPYLITLMLAGVVFVGFDGFSAAMIVIQTYADMPEEGNRLHAISEAVQGLGNNPVLLYAVVMAILMGIAIGYITIVTIVKWQGDEDYKNALKALFSVFQFVLHLFAMPEKNAGMIILSVGLTLATFGVTVALDNAINGKA